MPTIQQLPTATSVAASDLLPISQGGSVNAVAVGTLLAQTQPAIIISPPALLGRFSLGPGGPDTIGIGNGLTLASGTLSAAYFDPGGLPTQTTLSATDQFVAVNAGAAQLLGIDQVREMFSAGSNIAIDSTGVISASIPSSNYSLTGLSSVTAIGPTDLIGISQAGLDHNITYSNFIDGVTIDQAQTAAAASDTDSFWVAQTSNAMVRQPLGALWPWLEEKLPLWQRAVVEFTTNTTLSESAHNNTIIVCSSPVTISAQASELSSGFTCDLINLSVGPVSLPANVIASNGATTLASNQHGTVRCITYSGGTLLFVSMDLAQSTTIVPGQVNNVVATSVNASSVSVSWSAPTSGGAVSAYSVDYRVSGTTPWTLAGQTGVATNFAVGGLKPATSYDFSIYAANAIGNGPVSSVLTVTTLTAAVLPGAPTSVTISGITTASMQCAWAAPTVTGGTLVYTAQYRVTGQSAWNSAATGLSTTSYTFSNLLADASYDIQIVASNSAGSGPPSTLISAETAQTSGLVTSITWQLTPSGSYVHGVGWIGVNALVIPATAPIQFGFSTSATVPPTSWTAAALVNNNLWGQYVQTPATAGTWHAWAEGTDGTTPTVYPTPFTVT
jgi:hypothetical protein